MRTKTAPKRRGRPPGSKNKGPGRPPKAKSPDSIDTTLDQRAAHYGLFAGQAEISQNFKQLVYHYLVHRDKTLDVDQAEALEMIVHKIARIINGDADYADSWRDIAGYAMLISDRLEGNPR
jgi:hypothetical protein